MKNALMLFFLAGSEAKLLNADFKQMSCICRNKIKTKMKKYVRNENELHDTNVMFGRII